MSKDIEYLLDDKFIDMWKEDNFYMEGSLPDHIIFGMIGTVGVGSKTMDRWIKYVISLGMEFRDRRSCQHNDQSNVYATDPATMRMAYLHSISLEAEQGNKNAPVASDTMYIAIPKELAEKILVLGALP